MVPARVWSLCRSSHRPARGSVACSPWGWACWPRSAWRSTRAIRRQLLGGPAAQLGGPARRRPRRNRPGAAPAAGRLVRDLQTGGVQRVHDLGRPKGTPRRSAHNPTLSADGQLVAFEATDAGVGGAALTNGVWLADRATGLQRLITTGGTGAAFRPNLSARLHDRLDGGAARLRGPLGGVPQAPCRRGARDRLARERSGRSGRRRRRLRRGALRRRRRRGLRLPGREPRSRRSPRAHLRPRSAQSRDDDPLHGRARLDGPARDLRRRALRRMDDAARHRDGRLLARVRPARRSSSAAAPARAARRSAVRRRSPRSPATARRWPSPPPRTSRAPSPRAWPESTSATSSARTTTLVSTHAANPSRSSVRGRAATQHHEPPGSTGRLVSVLLWF